MTYLRPNSDFFQQQTAVKDPFAFIKALRVTDKSQKVWLALIFQNTNPIALRVDLQNFFGNSFLNYGIDIRFIQKLFGLHLAKTTECYTLASNRMLESIESPIDRTIKVYTFGHHVG